MVSEKSETQYVKENIRLKEICKRLSRKCDLLEAKNRELNRKLELLECELTSLFTCKTALH